MTDNQHSSKPQALSRGEMLKVISAMGMAITASSLAPEQWIKPVVEAGVVPAHAQSSLHCVSPYSIDRCQIEDMSRQTNDDLRLVRSHFWCMLVQALR